MAVMSKRFQEELQGFFHADPQSVIATLEMVADTLSRGDEPYESSSDWIKIQKHLAQARRAAKNLY